MSGIHGDLREIHSIGERTRERLVGTQTCPALGSHGILLCGISDARAGFLFQRLRPDIAQVLVTLSGRGDVLLPDGWAPCTVGTAYLTPPGVPHAYRAMESRAAWQVGWVTYEAGADVVTGPAPRLAEADPEPFAAALRGLCAEAATAVPDPGLLTDWAGIVHACARRVARLGAPPQDGALAALFQAVAADPSYPWDLETLARRADVSGEHLRRLCHARYGRSPMRQVTHLRMRHAAALLASGRYTVERAAEAVGYTNPFAFSAAFKRERGHPPSHAGRPAPEVPRAEAEPEATL